MKPPPPTPDDFRRRRRERRLQRTLDLEAEVSRWAARHGFTLRVLNDGHHWLLQKPGFVAEWWPSSAKLVLNRDYVHDRHAPHWPEVAAAIQEAMNAGFRVQGWKTSADAAQGPAAQPQPPGQAQSASLYSTGNPEPRTLNLIVTPGLAAGDGKD